MSYQLMADGVIELATQKCIPADPSNVDYQRYVAWVARGNTPLPLPAPVRPTIDHEYGMLNDWVKAVVVEAGIDAIALKQRVEEMRKSR